MATLHATNPFHDKINALAAKLSLTDEQFEELSRQATRELRDTPSQYKTKVLSMAVLGYISILLMVAFVLSLLIGTIIFFITMHHFAIYGIKLVFVLGCLALVVFKALWIKHDPPQGITVTRKEAPALFQLIDELAKKLNTKVDIVLADDNYNAAVVQVPVISFLDIHRNYLMLGLPLMFSHTPEQFKAVLAHELGHLSGNHSKSSAWIYNLRIRWAHLINTIANDSSIAFFLPFYLFFSWFSPRFCAYSLALARAHELEADADAVKIVGAKKFSESMLLLPVHGKFLSDHFWQTIIDGAKSNETPPAQVYNLMQQSIGETTHEPKELEVIIAEALKEKGSGADTHPPLKERLTEGRFTPVLKLNDQGLPMMEDPQSAELMETISKPLPKDESAAAVYLGPALEPILAQINQGWNEQIAVSWQQRHEFFKGAYERLAEIEAQGTEQPLTLDLLREKAYLLSETDGHEASRAACRQILEMEPDDATANFRLGVSLIIDKNEEAVPLLERAMALRSMLAADVCPMLISYYTEQGRAHEAESYKDKLKEFEAELVLAKKERMSVDGKSTLEKYAIDEDTLEYLRAVFQEVPQVDLVWIAQKQVEHFVDCPYVVLGIEMYSGDSNNKLAVAQALMANLQMPCEFCVSVFELGSGSLRKKMQSIPNALIYQKKVHGNGK